MMEYWKKKWSNGVLEIKKEKAAFCGSEGFNTSTPILQYSNTPITHWASTYWSDGNMKQWSIGRKENGVMEYWNNGVMKMEKRKRSFRNPGYLVRNTPRLHYSTTPVFQCSTTPLLQFSKEVL